MPDGSKFWKTAPLGWRTRRILDELRQQGETPPSPFTPQAVSPDLARTVQIAQTPFTGRPPQIRPAQAPPVQPTGFGAIENAPQALSWLGGAARRALWRPELTEQAQMEYPQPEPGLSRFTNPFLASPVGRLISPSSPTPPWYEALPGMAPAYGPAEQTITGGVKAVRQVAPGLAARGVRAAAPAVREFAASEAGAVGKGAGKAAKGAAEVPAEAVAKAVPEAVAPELKIGDVIADKDLPQVQGTIIGEVRYGPKKKGIEQWEGYHIKTSKPLIGGETETIIGKDSAKLIRAAEPAPAEAIAPVAAFETYEKMGKQIPKGWKVEQRAGKWIVSDPRGIVRGQRPTFAQASNFSIKYATDHPELAAKVPVAPIKPAEAVAEVTPAKIPPAAVPEAVAPGVAKAAAPGAESAAAKLNIGDTVYLPSDTRKGTFTITALDDPVFVKAENVNGETVILDRTKIQVVQNVEVGNRPGDIFLAKAGTPRTVAEKQLQERLANAVESGTITEEEALRMYRGQPKPAEIPTEEVPPGAESAAAKGAVGPTVPAGQARAPQALPPAEAAAPGGVPPVTTPPIAKGTPPPSGGVVGKVMTMWKEPPKQPGIPFGERMREFWRAVEEQTSDKFAGANKLASRQRKILGGQVPVEIDIEIQAALLAGVPEGALQRSKDVFRSMRQVLGEGIDEDYVNTYLHLRGNIDIVQQKGPQRLIAGGVKGVEEAKKGMEELRLLLGPEKFARVERASEVVRDTFRDYLRLQVKEGLISPELGQTLEEMYPWYSPIRYTEKLTQVLEGTGGRAMSVTRNDLRRLSKIGSEAARERPLTTLPRYILRVELLLQRNRAARAFIRTAEQDIQIGDQIKRVAATRPVAQVEGKVIFRRPAGEIRGTLSFMEDGKRVAYEVPKWIENEAKNFSFIDPNTFERVASAINAISRVGFTAYNPTFFVPNFAIDTLTAFLGSGVGPRGIVEALARNLKNIVKEDRVVAEMRRFGAGQSGFWGKTPEGIVREVEKRGQLVLRSRKDWKGILGLPVKAIGELGHAIEMTPRTAIYQKGIRRGLPVERAILEARRGTIDFQRAGLAVRHANNLFLYLNAGYQGALLPGRMLRDVPASRYRLAGLLAATGAVYMWNRQFPEYEDVPDFIKYGSTAVMLPSEEYDRDGNKVPHYITVIPNMREWAAFTGMQTYLMRKLDKDDPTSFGQFASAWAPGILPFGQITGTSGLPVPTALGETLTEMALNKNVYQGREIVPQTLQGLPPEQQFQQYTPESLKKIGQTFNLSPLQIEHFINNVFGGVGRIGVSIGEKAIGKEKPSSYISHLVEQLKAITPPQVPIDEVRLRRQDFLGSLEHATRQAVLKASGEREAGIPVIDTIVRRLYRTYGGQLADNEARAAKNRLAQEARQKGVTPDKAYYQSSRWKFFDQQTERDSWLAVNQKPDGTPYGGVDWRKNYEKAMVELSARSDIRQELLGPFRDREPRSELEKAVKGYYDTADQFVEDTGGTKDIGALADALNAYLNKLSPELEGKVLERLGLWDTPSLRQFRRDKRALEVYFGLPDYVKKKYGVEGAFKQEQILRLKGSWDAARIVREGNNLAAVEAVIEKARQNFRRRHPDLEQALIRWGYLEKPIALQKSARPLTPQVIPSRR